MEAIPLWTLFVATTMLVIGMLELGYRIGRRTHRRSPQEKESPVGAFAAAMLGLSAFMLGFTFNIAAERYQARKEKVRDEVTAIQTAYLRSEFLPDPERGESKALFARYLTAIVRSPPARGRPSAEVLARALALGNDWHRRLWTIAAASGRKNADSNTIALYVESLDQVFALHAERAMLEVPVVRLPIWAALYGLTCLAVMGVAYQSGIAGSKRSKAGFFLAGSFALVMSLIADLDRVGGYIQVPHEPYEHLLRSLATTSGA